MFCNNCGQQIIEGMNHCSFCGTPVEQKPAVDLSEKSMAHPYAPSTPTPVAPTPVAPTPVQPAYKPQTNASMYYQQNGYQNQSSPMMVQPEKKGGSGLSIASMVIGIVCLVSCCGAFGLGDSDFASFMVGTMFFVAFAACVSGLVLGIVALAKGFAGKGMAVAGVILNSIVLAMYIFFFVCILIGVSMFI